MPHGAVHVRIRSAAMPCMCISEKEISSRGHLAICVYVYDYTNNTIIIIIMCIDLVHGIFMGNRVRSGIMSIVLFPAIILLHMHPISST